MQNTNVKSLDTIMSDFRTDTVTTAFRQMKFDFENCPRNILPWISDDAFLFLNRLITEVSYLKVYKLSTYSDDANRFVELNQMREEYVAHQELLYNERWRREYDEPNRPQSPKRVARRKSEWYLRDNGHIERGKKVTNLTIAMRLYCLGEIQNVPTKENAIDLLVKWWEAK